MKKNSHGFMVHLGHDLSVTTKKFCPTLRERFGGHFSDEAKLDLGSELSVAKEVLGGLQQGFHRKPLQHGHNFRRLG